jgi:hypothetical protein
MDRREFISSTCGKLVPEVTLELIKVKCKGVLVLN